jgi:hypothetical protein
VRATLLVLALAALAGCARRGAQVEDPAAARARARLHQRLDELAAADPWLAHALARPGDVQVAIRSELATTLVREVVRRYLDRVELDLALEKQVHQEGKVQVGTLFGKMKAGEWAADVVVHRVRGVMSAAPPRLAVAAQDRVSVSLPVSLRKAQGSATVRFTWDGRGVASVVCRDFQVTRHVNGRLLAEEYTLSGSVRLAAGPQSVRAEPVFPNRAFRLKVDLLPASWSEVRAAVDEQDKLLRCGLAIDPKDVLPRLSQLLRDGFEIKLPRAVFRPVDLPGSVGGVVSLAGRTVELTLATEAVEMTPAAIWYSASVRSRTAGGGAPAP